MDVGTPPKLIVVAGRPGAGKTTLARALADAIGCPLASRDAMRGGLAVTLGTPAAPAAPAAPGDAEGRAIREAFFDAIRLLLARRITLLAEAAYQQRLWQPDLDALRDIADVRLIVCAVDPVLADARRRGRASADPLRARLHGAADATPPGAPAAYEPPRVAGAPTLIVDTADGYRPTLDAIVAFALGG